MTMRYRYLLVDLDDTLLDYRRAERLSLIETLASVGVEADESVCQAYSAINRELWDLKEKGVITRAQLRHQRFSRMMPLLGLKEEMADEVNARYSARLCVHGETLPGAEKLLSALHGPMKIAAVTNGVSRVQRSRLNETRILPWLDAVIISEEVGLQKPDPAMIECGLRALGCEEKRLAVMLGDSLTADIAAARAAGIDSIWLDPAARASDEATYCVKDLAEAETLLKTLE